MAKQTKLHLLSLTCTWYLLGHSLFRACYICVISYLYIVLFVRYNNQKRLDLRHKLVFKFKKYSSRNFSKNKLINTHAWKVSWFLFTFNINNCASLQRETCSHISPKGFWQYKDAHNSQMTKKIHESSCQSQEISCSQKLSIVSNKQSIILTDGGHRKQH